MKGTTVPRNGGSGTARWRKRKRNYVLYGLCVLGISYFAENIAWRSSIFNDIAASTMGDTYSQESGGSAFCLLIKDDNDILPEWVAYHYHVFQMRRLIVAVDPDSKTSPLDVLQAWTQNFDYFGLDVTIWNDEDYTPEFFYKTKDYSKLPNSVRNSVVLANPSKKKNSAQLNDPILRTNWHTNRTYVQEHQEEVREEVIRINNHRFRQKNFVSECFRQIKKEKTDKPGLFSSPFWKSDDSDDTISWVVHIDTDEYLVPNPWIASYLRNEMDASASKHFERKDLARIFPDTPFKGSLWKFFKVFFKHSKKYNDKTCVMMPRILFGSKEDRGNSTIATAATTTTISDNNRASKLTWYHSKFETLRWKYHANFESDARPKSMINVDQLRETDDVFQTKMATSIHRPITAHLNNFRTGCSAEPKIIYNDRRFAQPIAVYHYLGSLERYLSRADARRDESIYERNNQKGSYAKGDGNDADKAVGWWIGGWLDNFVAAHNAGMAYTVLPEPYATRQPLK